MTPICSIPDCPNPVKIILRGWCTKHYERWRRHGDPLTLIASQFGPICSTDECQKVAKKHGMCAEHYAEWRGDPCTIEGCQAFAIVRNLCCAHYNQWLYQNTRSRQQSDERRRARETNAFVQDIDRDLIYDVFHGHCYLCGLEIDPGSPWHLEHLQPLSKGGKHDYHNVAPAHPSCNESKSDKTLIELLSV